MSHGIKNTGTFPIILIITAIAEYDRIRGIRQNMRNTTEYAENDGIGGIDINSSTIIPQAIINH